MPGPFPGMDPYLEDPSVWEEFHHVLITEAMYQLSDRLPDGYIAKIQERVKLVSTTDEAAKHYLPDVTVVSGYRLVTPVGHVIACRHSQPIKLSDAGGF